MASQQEPVILAYHSHAKRLGSPALFQPVKYGLTVCALSRACSCQPCKLKTSKASSCFNSGANFTLDLVLTRTIMLCTCCSMTGLCRNTNGGFTMYVVIGATGNTGSAVVETLLSRKQPVRIVVRSADKGMALKAKGAEIVVASLDDVSSLVTVFEGAKGVYLLVPPNYGAAAWLAGVVDRSTSTDGSRGRSREEERHFACRIFVLNRWTHRRRNGANSSRSLRRAGTWSSGEEPDNSPPLLFHGQLGSGSRRSQGTRHLADVHCASGHGSHDLDHRYRPYRSGAIDGRWKGQPDSGTRRAGRI
ncbi:MAG: hypothetical protein E8D47_10340 [Nitrospira sp.]|nr:MAG: hypothetical protein E8D47_10340 [Nitrospira sp.]